jgi:hypothetical protein
MRGHFDGRHRRAGMPYSTVQRWQDPVTTKAQPEAGVQFPRLLRFLSYPHRKGESGTCSCPSVAGAELILP